MEKESPRRSSAAIWRLLSARFSRYLDDKTSDIKHQDIISDFSGRTELTGSYLSSIILANLIALLGLLINSVAVVIGAMLISPLMGPIFSLGLAFTIGDLRLTRRAVRNITYSVLLVVFVATLFTLLSPLKDNTHEIISRTRPNIYDLLIAAFAGTAGALAICSRKNYLFTTAGVAVATAVIPPLSVVGYGIGTWQLGIAAGGFLLFFTNLVAIVISSNTVFYISRFRGSMADEPHYAVRRRFQILGTVLVIISIPLIFTLVTDIRKVKLAGKVDKILKANLNRKQNSRLTRVTISKKDGNVMVNASINTVKYLDNDIQKNLEKELSDKIGKQAKLELEQVIVRSGAIEPPSPLRAVIPAASSPAATLASLREKTIARLGEGCREIESYITPYKVSDCSITFSEQDPQLRVLATIARDYPPSQLELRWLSAVMAKTLAQPIALTVEMVPFLPPITFTDKDDIDAHSRNALNPLKQIGSQLPAYRLIVETPRANHRSDARIKRRIARLREYLVKNIGIQDKQISVIQGNDNLLRVKVKEKLS